MQKATWFILPLFPLFYIFFIASIAETNRAPFDLAEAESELVSGFMTEHAAGIFVFFFLGEYASIILICILITLILLGGYDVITIIFFLEKILYTLIFFLYTSIYVVFLNLNFFILNILNFSDTIINNKIFNINTLLDYNNFYFINNNTYELYTLNLFNILKDIKESFQFNEYISIISYNYSNYMKLNIEHIIYDLIEKSYFSNNFNIIVDILKNISDSKIFLSLIYALGISIKTIILIFSFI
jgi:NADH dehydrogenase